MLWPVLVPFGLYDYDCLWPVYRPCRYISFSDWLLFRPTESKGLMYGNNYCSCGCCNIVSEADLAKPKDASEKKSGQKVSGAKPSKQQECIVCKKVG